MFESLSFNEDCIFENIILSISKSDYSIVIRLYLKNYNIDNTNITHLKEIENLKIKKNNGATIINYTINSSSSVNYLKEEDAKLIKDTLRLIFQKLKYHMENKNIGFQLNDHGYNLFKIGTYDQYIADLI
jgi:hypothetical protein